jgi:hypothetical protein
VCFRTLTRVYFAIKKWQPATATSTRKDDRPSPASSTGPSALNKAALPPSLSTTILCASLSVPRCGWPLLPTVLCNPSSRPVLLSASIRRSVTATTARRCKVVGVLLFACMIARRFEDGKIGTALWVDMTHIMPARQKEIEEAIRNNDVASASSAMVARQTVRREHVATVPSITRPDPGGAVLMRPKLFSRSNECVPSYTTEHIPRHQRWADDICEGDHCMESSYARRGGSLDRIATANLEMLPSCSPCLLGICVLI